MKCKSERTSILDAYRAGLALGESLREIMPEAIILFPSVHYSEDFEDLFDGLYDGLETRDVLVVGGTGDGYYERSVVESIGVGAMAFSGGGRVEWGLALSDEGAMTDPRKAGLQCATNLVETMGGEPDFAIIFAPMICDGTLFADGIREVLSAPCVGALTGDDRQYKGGAVLANGKVVGDSAVILGMKGGFHQSTSLGSGYHAVGTPGVIERCEGTTVFQISGLPATEYLRKQWGAPMRKIDLAVASLGVLKNNKLSIRSPCSFDNEVGSLCLFGSIPQGSKVTVCSASKENLLAEVGDIATACMNQSFKPTGALVISCAGRKWLLGKDVEEELKAIEQAIPEGLPLLGLPSFGEFGPRNDVDSAESGSTFFHNVTCVITLFGEAKE